MKRAAAFLMTASIAFAMAGSVAQADGYGAAGCGLGSLIFGDDPGLVQILAATTNGSSANQTFGITSGTSNCSDSGGGAASAKAFIETNREALAKDIARGEGETISNLSTLAGCRDAGAVGQALQGDFQAIFPEASTSDQQVSEAVLKSLSTHAELACGQLG